MTALEMDKMEVHMKDYIERQLELPRLMFSIWLAKYAFIFYVQQLHVENAWVERF